MVVLVVLACAAVVLVAVGIGESFWRSDTRRRRAFYRENDR